MPVVRYNFGEYYPSPPCGTGFMMVLIVPRRFSSLLTFLLVLFIKNDPTLSYVDRHIGIKRFSNFSINKRHNFKFPAGSTQGWTQHLISMKESPQTNNPQETPSRLNRSSNQKAQRELLKFMEKPMTSMVGDSATTAEMLDDSLYDLVECVVKAADGRKAENIVALQVHHVSTLTSVLVILSGNSRPQNQAIAAAILKDVEAQFEGQRPGGSGVPEGSADSGWILLDYGSVMVHIMTPKSRLFYNVEGQWKEKGGKYLDISDLLIPNTIEQEVQRLHAPENAFDSTESDPFWS